MQALETLRRDGIFRLPTALWIGQTMRYLERCPVLPGHVGSRPREGVWHHAMQDVMAAPHFLAYAKSFTPLASEYFGSPAHLWSLNAFITDEHTPLIPSIMEWHRDKEAKKILVLFVFGTDVDPEGAHCFVNGSHADPHANPVTASHTRIWGLEGTAFLADTTGLHCGLRPNKRRVVLWARFADEIPQAKAAENLPDVP